MAGEAFGLGRPEVKAKLARVGQSLDVDATIGLLRRPKPGESGDVLILDRVVEGVTPEYCVHGYVECIGCYRMLWLGDETERIIREGRAFPLCKDCAAKHLRPGRRPKGLIEDHLRTDGHHH